ncbi:tetratricopeptide repeat protein [Verrucomicrobiota bacterium]
MRIFVSIFLLALALVTVGLYRFMNNDWVLFRQADEASKNGNISQAVASYSVLWSNGFKPTLVFPRLFASYLKLGQPDKAVQVARKAVFLAQSSAGGSRAIKDAEDGNSIPEWKARLELARTLSYTKQYPESIAEYSRLLQMGKKLPQAQLELARVLFWAGNNNEALIEFLRVPNRVLQKDDRVVIAELFAAASLYVEAEFEYRLLLAEFPKDVVAREKLADLLSWGDQYDESLREYEKILRQTPDNIRVRRKYANVLIWSGQHQKAIKELKKTLSANTTGK